MKEDRRVYMGRSGDVRVNRLGFATIREAALAAQPQLAAISSAILVNSIETGGQVAVAEKKRTVQPAARTPYMRPSGDARVTTRSQTQPPTQVQPPHNFGPTSFIPFGPAHNIPATPTPPMEPITLVPDTPIEDTTPPPREPKTRKPKPWNNWQLAAREKLRAGGSGSLLMMEFKSLVNPSVWNWLWEDKESVVSYVGEDEEVSVYRTNREVFAADDAMGTLSLNRKLL